MFDSYARVKCQKWKLSQRLCFMPYFLKKWTAKKKENTNAFKFMPLYFKCSGLVMAKRKVLSVWGKRFQKPSLNPHMGFIIRIKDNLIFQNGKLLEITLNKSHHCYLTLFAQKSIFWRYIIQVFKGRTINQLTLAYVNCPTGLINSDIMGSTQGTL